MRYPIKDFGQVCPGGDACTGGPIEYAVEMYRSGRNEADSKSVDGSNRPGVRIPPSPPKALKADAFRAFLYEENHSLGEWFKRSLMELMKISKLPLL